MNNKNDFSPVDKRALVDVYREALVSGEDLDKLNNRIEKLAVRGAAAKKVETSAEQNRQEKLKNAIPRFVRLGAFALPLTFIALGLFLIGNALLPISEYYFKTLPQLSVFDLKTPIPRESVLDITPTVIAGSSKTEKDEETFEDNFGPVIMNTQLDYTNLANWFDDEELTALKENQSENSYILEIPKLDILNANVKIGGTDLDQSLIQYPGTADPGKPGSPVIFGHSVLRQFYNPYERNPRRYISIFSKIMTLQKGDEIFIEKDGVRYTYRVSDKTEVKPEDVFILSQNYDSKKIKLVTCVPEGTYLRRGIITADLVE